MKAGYVNVDGDVKKGKVEKPSMKTAEKKIGMCRRGDHDGKQPEKYVTHRFVGRALVFLVTMTRKSPVAKSEIPDQ